MGIGGYIWALHGRCTGHPKIPNGQLIKLSTPKALDASDTDPILTTSSGNQYKIVSFRDNREEVLKQIREDIENDGYVII